MPKDYALTQANDTEAAQSGLANPAWYRTKMDPADIRPLMEKSDAIAARDTALWLGLMIV
ncbi:MAG: hypothetical protein HRU30_12805, partial [Rhodobacteraceae bacterium]|nr:hypothetical protein [Paracoccaceae bacterium]